MVELKKRVRRKTSATVFDRGRRHVFLSLEPSAGLRQESVGVRLAGTRDTYRIEAESLYSIAVKIHNAAIEKRAKQIQKAQGCPIRSARSKAKKELAADLKG
jgi:hypothetical protein